MSAASGISGERAEQCSRLAKFRELIEHSVDDSSDVHQALHRLPAVFRTVSHERNRNTRRSTRRSHPAPVSASRDRRHEVVQSGIHHKLSVMLRSVCDETDKHVGDFRTGIERILLKCLRNGIGTLSERRKDLLFAEKLLTRELVRCIIGFLAPHSIGDVVVPECYVSENFGEGSHVRTRFVIEFVCGHLVRQGSELLVYSLPLTDQCLRYGFCFCRHLPPPRDSEI